jgi:hypothetical protein
MFQLCETATSKMVFTRVPTSTTTQERPEEEKFPQSHTCAIDSGTIAQHHSQSIYPSGNGKTRKDNGVCLKWLVIRQFVFLVATAFVLGTMLLAHRQVTKLRDYNLENMVMMGSIVPENSTSSAGCSLSADRDSKRQKKGLKLAWLMSFPNSGTSYTLTLVQQLSLSFTAGNYANEPMATTKPVLSHHNLDGPIWFNPDTNVSQNLTFTYPKHYALTKTHCGGRCATCYPSLYLETMHSFREKCFQTSRLGPNNATGEALLYGSYPLYDVAKAVHLIRNPVDNIVSRFHHERLSNTSLSGPGTRKDFREFCSRVNKKTISTERPLRVWTESIMSLLEHVPCRSDFFRYIHWHNLAFFTTDDLELDTIVFYYEDYGNDFNRTVNRVLEFLALPQIGSAAPFTTGKSYSDFYTSDELLRIRQACELMATRQTWKHIRRYFV